MSPSESPPDLALAEKIVEAVVARLAEKLGAPPQRYFTVKQSAQYTGLSEDSIRYLIETSKLTGLRPVAGRVLIDKQELDNLICSSTRAPRTGRGRRS